MKQRRVLKERRIGEQKICPRCHQSKDESEFFFYLGRYSPYCNDCKNAYQREWYAKNTTSKKRKKSTV